MKTFLESKFNQETLHRPIEVGIADILNGDFMTFTEANMTNANNLVDVMYASFAFAGFFPPVEAFGSQFFDGSTIWDIDIFTAVNKCKAQGFAEKDIVVDVVMTSAANLQKVHAEDYKSLSMLFRYLEISSFYGSMDGLLRAKFAYPSVNFRYAITPSESLPSSMYPMNLSLD
jgi:predicted acylesterase/phospholipase RssA